MAAPVCCICAQPDPPFRKGKKFYCAKHRPKKVTLFGTLIRETKGCWYFAPEDEESHEVRVAKSIGKWDDEAEAMTIPRWLAEKEKLLSKPPEDDDPAWEIILYEGVPIFRAETVNCECWGEEPEEK